MQQDAASRVDQERVRELAEMEVDDRTEQSVDRNVHASDALKLTEGDDGETGRCYHSYTAKVCL